MIGLGSPIGLPTGAYPSYDIHTPQNVTPPFLSPGPAGPSSLPPLPRKRRANSPSPPLLSTFYPDCDDSPPCGDPHREKRRRANLMSGFSGLSISPRPVPAQAQTCHPSNRFAAIQDHVPQIGNPQPDAGIARPMSERRDDMISPPAFESFVNHATSPSILDQAQTRPGINRETSFSLPMMENGIYHPGMPDGLVATSPRGKKRDESEMELDQCMEMNNEAEMMRGRKRRKDTGHDSDMEMVAKTKWYEPERDRIVITSLSDTSTSSSRSTSPNSRAIRTLEQPGMRGFTLSPSLLTHLLNAQRGDISTLHLPQSTERSLVMYRPAVLPPGFSDWARKMLPNVNLDLPMQGSEVVRTWRGEPGVIMDDEGRFEELNDDGEMFISPANSPSDDVQMMEFE
ncbi:hypothetical protein TREMEDRAFT_72608 [Tremella mesenterica DSM 1558]|uniref:uncharacterized protein n=1 Tax=Tremella mesenterica (strain ATCC 24925 / CBS 8224 / DSM 1558 / NBRC 9311 / NRRL Y-6157 / RJB 2259-6 / UBC 559-6) TaxID=578456 RepID=UPI0003F491FB|nr:uncharacterized protein TREMEDRAFT_72608 [Tremella mesenterica DSM 1558]EIW71933.1 hypothetical protein TREMEDRAFT_72608 [Tremella mesenterica DSM 1558]